MATIFEIEEEGIEIKRARIAERLGISAPSVTEHIQRMEKQGLVKVDERNSVSLTAEGKEKATTVVRRHRLAERLLVDIIGLGWAEAHKEADRWEHVISDLVEEKLVALLGDPDTCPHGNPIPNADGSLKDSSIKTKKSSIPLTQISETKQVTIRRIGERIETNDDALAFVATNNLIPGKVITVKSAGRELVVIEDDSATEISIPAETAQSMFVEAN